MNIIKFKFIFSSKVWKNKTTYVILKTVRGE